MSTKKQESPDIRLSDWDGAVLRPIRYKHKQKSVVKKSLSMWADNEFGIALAIRHAPKGKPVMVGGKLFAPGEFIPDDVWSKLTEAEKKFDKRLASLTSSEGPAKETPSAVKETPPTTESKKPNELTDKDRKAALTKLAKLPTSSGLISPPLEIKRERDTISAMKEIISKGKFEDGWLDPGKITATQDEVEADKVKRMINSIGRGGFEGLNKPIVAVKLSDGRIYIDEGHHRTTASMLLGCKVPVRLYTIPSQDTALSLWAEEITRDCFLSAGDDTEAAILAAQIIVATQPFPDDVQIGSSSSSLSIDAFLAHDIHNRQAQGILNRSLVAARGMSASARKDLDAALKKASTGSGEAILNFIDKYRVQLAKVLTQTQIASILSGARNIADKVPTLAYFPGAIPPPPTLEPHEAVKLVERLEGLTPYERAEEVYKLSAAEQVYVNQAIAARAAVPPVAPPITISQPTGGGAPEDVHLVTIDEAVKNLAGRNVMDRQKYDALEAAARAKAFTVANVAAEETLTKIRDSLAENVREGADYETWRNKVMEGVGQGTFMSDAHQETVFRTNIQTGFSDGQESILSNPLVRSGFPYRARDAIHDDRVRKNHKALEKLGIQGTNIYRADDPVWQMFRAPWDYNDRCSDTAMTVRQAAEKGINEAKVWLETGVEPTDKAWVKMPDFRPPPGFQRAVASAPMSIQLSMQSIATFAHDVSSERRDGGGKWTTGGDTGKEAGTSKLKTGMSRIKSVVGKVGGRMSQLIDRVPAVGRVKRGMLVAISAINARNEKKYGSTKAKAIMWGGAIVGGYGVAFGAGALVGIPGVPVLNDLIGILAATAITDVGSLIKRSVGLSMDGGSLTELAKQFHKEFADAVKKLIAQHKDDLVAALREDGGAARRVVKIIGGAKAAIRQAALSIDSELSAAFGDGITVPWYGISPAKTPAGLAKWIQLSPGANSGNRWARVGSPLAAAHLAATGGQPPAASTPAPPQNKSSTTPPNTPTTTLVSGDYQPPAPDLTRKVDLYEGGGSGGQVVMPPWINHTIVGSFSDDPTTLTKDYSVTSTSAANTFLEHIHAPSGYKVVSSWKYGHFQGLGQSIPYEYTITVLDGAGQIVSVYDSSAPRDEAYVTKRATQVANWLDGELAKIAKAKAQNTITAPLAQFAWDYAQAAGIKPGAAPFELTDDSHDRVSHAKYKAKIEAYLKSQFPKLIGAKQHAPHGGMDTIEHTMNIVSEANLRTTGLSQRDAEILRLGMVYHDVGKQYDPLDHDHPRRSAEDAEVHLWQFGLTPKEVHDTLAVIKWHDAYGDAMKAGGSDKDARKIAQLAYEYTDDSLAPDARKAEAHRINDLLMRAWQSDLASIPGLTKKPIPGRPDIKVSGFIDVDTAGPVFKQKIADLIDNKGPMGITPAIRPKSLPLPNKPPSIHAGATKPNLVAPGKKWGELVQRTENIPIGTPVPHESTKVPPPEVYDEAHKNPDLNYARAFNMGYDGPTGKIITVYHGTQRQFAGGILSTGIRSGNSGDNVFGHGVYAVVNGARSIPGGYNNGAVAQMEVHTGRTIAHDDLVSNILPKWTAANPALAKKLRYSSHHAHYTAAALWAGYSTIAVNYSTGNPTFVVLDPSRIRMKQIVDGNHNGISVKALHGQVTSSSLTPDEIKTPKGHIDHTPVTNGVPEGWRGTPKTS